MIGRTDLIGWLLLALLTALALVAGAAFMGFAHITPWGLVVGLIVCVAFVAVGLPIQVKHAPRNTLVHGAAKPASESEAQAAARGSLKSPTLHDQTFQD